MLRVNSHRSGNQQCLGGQRRDEPRTARRIRRAETGQAVANVQRRSAPSGAGRLGWCGAYCRNSHLSRMTSFLFIRTISVELLALDTSPFIQRQHISRLQTSFPRDNKQVWALRKDVFGTLYKSMTWTYFLRRSHAHRLRKGVLGHGNSRKSRPWKHRLPAFAHSVGTER